jgi:hypothetical protein
MLELKTDQGVSTLRASGVLKHGDYEKLVPELEQLLEQGARRVLLDLDGFQGFTPAALVDELRFDVRHRKDFDRVAVLGGTLEGLGVRLLAPIFSGQVKVFEPSKRAEAVAWLQEQA